MAKNAKEKARILQQNPDQPYTHPQKKQRKDCTRDLAKICVVNFCHSDEASRVDTNHWGMIEVKGSSTRHEPRIWEVTSVDDKYKLFRDSIEYKTHLAAHPNATISRSVFAYFLCPCVRNPMPESCVDEKKATVEEYAKGFRSILLHDENFKRQLETCQCPLHTRATRSAGNNNNLPSQKSFETMMKRGRPEEIVSSTTCAPAVIIVL